MKTKLLLIIVILSLTICSYGSNLPLGDRIQKILDKGINKYGARGVSVAIIFPDGAIWTGVSGMSHDTVAIEPDMLFAIGSVTKNVVAALTLKLTEENILSLDDPLSKWLEKYPHIDSNKNDCYKDGKVSHWHLFRERVLGPIIEKADPPSMDELCSKYRIKDHTTASNMIVTVKRRFRVALMNHLRNLVSSDDEVDTELEEIMQFLPRIAQDHI